jgi:hypothetical protein
MGIAVIMQLHITSTMGYHAPHRAFVGLLSARICPKSSTSIMVFGTMFLERIPIGWKNLFDGKASPWCPLQRDLPHRNVQL